MNYIASPFLLLSYGTQVYLTVTSIQVLGWILDQTFHIQLDKKYLLKYTTFFEV